MSSQLSIIIPVYNAAKYLDRCLESVAAQTFRDFTLIIVNDGSTDETPQIISDFNERHDDINTVIINQENHGLPQSRRIAVDAVETEYTGFVDADDWIDADYYEKLMSAALSTSCDIICTGYTLEKGGKSEKHKQPSAAEGIIKIGSEEAASKVFERREVFQYVWNKIYKSEILKSIDYPYGNPIGEDFHIVMKCLAKSEDVALIGGCGYHYCIHGDNMTKVFGSAQKEGFELHRQFDKSFKGNSECKKSLRRYFMLEYMASLWAMYKSGNNDPEMSRYIFDYMRAGRADYIRNSHDRIMAKGFAALVRPYNIGFFSKVANIISR